jgi:hypothetical protein
VRHDIQSSNVVIALISACDVTRGIVATLSFDLRFGVLARLTMHHCKSHVGAVPQRYLSYHVAAVVRDFRDTDDTNQVHSVARFVDHDSFTDFVISRAVS